MSDLGPETFDSDIHLGRAQIRLPGGVSVELEKMIAIVTLTGTEEGMRLILHPMFEDDAIDVFRELAAEINAWADRKERDGVVVREMRREGADGSLP